MSHHVTLLCPGNFITGGPEGIHQLRQALEACGVPAAIAYYGADPRGERRDGLVHMPSADHAFSLRAYARYAPVVTKTFPDCPQSIVIIPETRLGLVDAWRCRVIVWWLSVDNAFGLNPWLSDPAASASFFTRAPWHLAQSAYAEDFLRRRSARAVLRMSDYTDEDALRRGEGGWPRQPRVAVFPRKGGALARSFFDRYPEFTPVPLDNLSKAQVFEALAASAVYVDFGSHPGKDRIPREAAALGTPVLVMRRGAACFREDVNVDADYLFEPEDVENGGLADRLRAVLQAPESAARDQARYRAGVREEKDNFLAEVRRVTAWLQPTVDEPGLGEPT